MTIYDSFAPFYDGPDQLRFAALFDQYLHEVLQRHPVAGQRVLDLACGTGTLAVYLADRGWDVVGVDASAAMLAQADAKAANVDVSGMLAFVQGDMCYLPISDARGSALAPAAFDLVTCAYDSLNYLLTNEHIAACFQGVAAALRPGGVFVADMNTRHFLAHDWPTCDVTERNGFVQIARSEFNPLNDCSTMLLTCFVEHDAGDYWRIDETHIERAYALDDVAMLLQQAGLCVEASYDCFTFDPLYPRSQRVAWVARKPDAADEDRRSSALSE